MRSSHRAGRRSAIVGVCVAVVCAAWVLFPPLRLHSLDEVRARRERETFRPEEYAERFWMSTLPEVLERAAPAAELLELIRRDPAAAKARHGRTAELGSIYYYFVRGEGRVLGVGEEEVAMSVAGGVDSKADLSVFVGDIFGNAIRNATGAVDVNRFENSQEFNAVSLELNRLAETKVIAPFREGVAAGARVRFVGCAEIEDEDRDLDPLRIVPVALEILR